MGSSLCGMTSDMMAEAAAGRQGLVIINLQKTRLDDRACLRIFGQLQAVMRLLGQQLGVRGVGRALMEEKEWVQ